MLATFSFTDAAAYFELQVQREEGERRQAEFDDAARFYRELAEIMPSFPIGYYGAFWDTRVGLGSRAEQCRSLAAVVRDPERQVKLLRLAGTYRRAAEIRRAAGKVPLPTSFATARPTQMRLSTHECLQTSTFKIEASIVHLCHLNACLERTSDLIYNAKTLIAAAKPPEVLKEVSKVSPREQANKSSDALLGFSSNWDLRPMDHGPMAEAPRICYAESDGTHEDE